MKILKIITSVFILASVVILSGCGSEITAYRLDSYNYQENERILVLPFLDARTFVDKNDPLKKGASEKARLIFVEELRKNKAFSRSIVMVPKVEGKPLNYSLYDVKILADKYNCNTVFTGQIFSFTGTRAASIPPRAGLFVRVFDAGKGRQVFAGESYTAAGVPGAEGGRERQCRVAAEKIIKNFTQKKSSFTALIKPADGEVPKILFLPYHERKNPVNIIEKNGGGPVVTSIYAMELARKGKADIIIGSDDPRAGYYEKLSKDEALSLARSAGADYVVRGEVVEFRRAQSVPSLWSAAISLSILAAQVVFAEVSGVDIATEVYRGSDGDCVFAKRQISHQKYVVSAEKTVRMLAGPLTSSILSAVNSGSTSVEPIIDNITVPQTDEEIKDAAAKLADESGNGKNKDNSMTVSDTSESEKSDKGKQYPPMRRR